MALVSSQCVAAGRILCRVHAEKEVGGRKEFAGSSWSRGGALGALRLEGCGREARWGDGGRRLQLGAGAKGRSIVSSALEGKDLGGGGGGAEGLFDKFLDHAVSAVAQREDVSPLPCQEEFRQMVASDGQSLIKNVAFESEKLRLFRCATINGGDNMQVLNVAICARPEYDLPIFCADFFSTPRMNIVVLDLNPLYNTEQRPDYKEKYFSPLLSMGNKYAELLPWGDKLTSESIQFFSPIVLWTRPGSREDFQETVFSAFKDYLAAWLDMAEKAEPSEDADEVAENRESHHRYLMWRATKVLPFSSSK
ncbi:hypothetical protein M758_4G031600 [Ceratodon purpureus]|nr:hypothetical protein M758_4G031600 [Ceratodon purpureus]